MNVRPVRLLAALSCVALSIVGFAQEATAPSYPPVTPGVAIEFPRDEGSHPEFRTEWWYVTGWLEDGAQAPLGFQVTFFRVRSGLGETNPSRFAARQILFAHAALADPRRGRLRHAERSVREGFDLAYTRSGRTDVRIDDWTLTQTGSRYDATVVDE